MRTRVRKAFTLVEILIVVVILGILAAIVVPQFTNATQDAQGGNIQTQLDTLNNQIELFKARNNGSLPLCAAGGAGAACWSDMTGAAGYLKDIPKNPACPSGAGNDPAAVDVDTPVAGHGWVYNTAKNSLEATYFDETAGKVTPGVP